MPTRHLALLLWLTTATWAHSASVGEPAQSLESYRDNVVLVNFWASWCAPCQNELPELNALAKEFSGKKVRVVAINVDKKKADGQKALERLGLKRAALEVEWDTASKTVSAWDIQAMPSSFIVDRKGIIRFVHTGFHANDPATWRSEIAALLH